MVVKFDIQKFTVHWHGNLVVKEITMKIASSEILGVIGPAGSGKTTFLRALNRMNELEAGYSLGGRILLDGEDINGPNYDLVSLRKRVGMVFALPVALPMSIYENIVYGPRLAGVRDRNRLDEIVERSLKAAFMWNEVKDRLSSSGMRLSGGQQQRLSLGRVLAMDPAVILLDEPSSGLDPISTSKIEEALTDLKQNYTIVLVTNNTHQAARVADTTAFFLMGELIELGPTEQIFTAPKQKQTDDYITGRFG